jgi:hypothetical protein
VCVIEDSVTPNNQLLGFIKTYFRRKRLKARYVFTFLVSGEFRWAALSSLMGSMGIPEKGK